MRDILGDLPGERAASVLDPTLDLIVLIRWEVVGRGEVDLAECLAHCRLSAGV